MALKIVFGQILVLIYKDVLSLFLLIRKHKKVLLGKLGSHTNI